jgi:stage V sporulation protein B
MGLPSLARAPIVAMVAGHLRFGLKAAPGSALTELNPRVDVIMVGVFLPDAAVGVYSFVSLITEGLLHLLSVLRVNVNPLLVPLLARKEGNALQTLLIRIRRLVYPSAAFVAIAVVGGFPLLVAVLGLEAEFMKGWPVLAVLCTGVFALSGYAAFGQILNQAGLPAYQSLATLASVLVNTLLCIVLIPQIELLGAAVSAASALILQMILVFVFLRSKTGIQLH